VVPAEAKAQTAAGAMAFARHYFAVVDYAYATGDTAPLAAISETDCLACTGVKDMVDAAYAAGGSFETSATQVNELAVPDGEPLGAVEVVAVTSEPMTRFLDSNGEEYRRFDAVSAERARIILVPVNSGWSVHTVAELI
jgi:hypothetical protein